MGVHHGNCISFAFTGSTPHGDMICAFIGVLRDDKIKTVWHVITDNTPDGEPKPWPHAVLTNADTFERVDA